jgi:hypothetical protein
MFSIVLGRFHQMSPEQQAYYAGLMTEEQQMQILQSAMQQ